MAAKSKTRKKNSATATEIKRREAEQRRMKSAGRRQIAAIILFAVSLLLLCIALVKGERVWNSIHNFMFGLFGICFYAWPIVLGTVSVLCAMDRLYGSVSAKLIEASIIVCFIGSLIEILLNRSYDGFIDCIGKAYLKGVVCKGGGAFGALIAYPFNELFDTVGASIIMILIIFVVLMLMTGTTLMSFFKMLSKPVKHIENAAENAYSQYSEKVQKNDRFNYDIPLDVEEEAERLSQEEDGLQKKKRRLLNTYKGTDEAGKPITSADSDSRSDNAETKPENEELIEKINQTINKKREDTQSGGFVAPENVAGGEHDTYRYPPTSLLAPVKTQNARSVSNELESTATKLVDTLRSFGVETRIIDISRGPAVTRYELQPSAGVKISKITNLADDIALNLATAGVRIEAPIPNKPAVGIEVPNKKVSMVSVREVIESSTFTNSKSKLSVAIGKDIAGEIMVTDIAKMPHGLIAGATGSGKSVCINSILISLLYKATPDEVKLLLIDPKVVELGVYNGIPHLLVPVVTDPRKASGALGWAVTEMEKRYKMFDEIHVKNLEGYNKVAQTREDIVKMPQIVIVIDELADLMMSAPNEVEDNICRIAQKARAAGMHLIIATQRPSVDVVTGLIKANIPSRVAFAVSSQVDSRTIIDMGGAEKLLGRGDMLFFPSGSIKPQRVQGCFVSDDEIERVLEYIKDDKTTEYDEDVMMEIERQAAKEKAAKSGLSEDLPSDDDPMLMDAIQCVVDAGQASTSLLQRRLKLGYARAARIVDQMEERGIVGPYEGSKPRQVLISKAQLLEMQARVEE
ncbi:MAG: DNA translocase FtsK 4TM domain-containing protein [bacterium]|nr:DNA translocase FtsK 4TM domain-containing protein [bacterium]